MNGELNYPESVRERRKWVEQKRPKRNPVDIWKPYAFHNETELTAGNGLVETSVIFLTNRECPWRCLMCDLWKNTSEDPVPKGAIPHQIKWALSQLPKAGHIKLYNSGSFFDHKAIPVEDYSDIAELMNPFQRVIVESHSDLIGEDALRFRDLINGKLEVAMGLETVHPEVLSKLNKGITIESFQKAAQYVTDNDIDLRVFILVKPPFMNENEGLEWACRSLDFAFEIGASSAVLIPTRGGNGAMEILQKQGLFAPPKIHTLEEALDYGISLKKGRVFADLWDLEKFADCKSCFNQRKQRLEQINRTQETLPYIHCAQCNYES